ncbi:hypothetical protein RDI58_009273 [Solanum bulbocastanum]|uniref:Uncharacterized protein n=1 Tax=Solanum bulbocastanum TaxID=147425 RepID=A0AAN8U3I4_SOLBU
MIEGSRTKQRINPSKNTIRADGIADSVRNLRRTLRRSFLSSSSLSSTTSPEPVTSIRKDTQVRARITPSRPSHERGEVALAFVEVKSWL